jgi:DNA-binding NarL/FixJ family response regulator
MIALAEVKTAPDAGLLPMNEGATAPARSVVRVWLTDDNAGIRCTVNELLARTGEFVCEHQFASAEALLQGLATLPHPDVILLDIEMGGMKGVDALRLIRAVAPAVRVLIMTAFFDPIYETQALRRGAAAFLVKSHAFARIAEEIHAVMGRPVPVLTPEPEPTVTRNHPGMSASSDAPAARLEATAALGRWLAQVATAFRCGAVTES